MGGVKGLNLPDVTVVMPTYNQANILCNTLWSLDCQTYPRHKYQVVVVDDGSDDNTLQLLQQSAVNNLELISYPKNMGAGHARNLGWQAGTGELIIFCDSDFILTPLFIESHVRTHQGEEHLAVSGMGQWNYVLTYDYGPLWSDYQKNLLEKEYSRPFIKKRLQKSQDGKLISKEDILAKKTSSFLIAPDNPLREWSLMYNEVINVFGPELKDFYCPWVSFCTGNVSIRKDVLIDLNGFDERFPRYEDWEFAYRYHLAGGRFCFSNGAESYIQLTPRHASKKSLAYDAHQLFCEKHPHLEIHLLRLDLEGKLSYRELSDLLQQHKKMQHEGAELHLFAYQFEKMARIYATGESHTLNRNFFGQPDILLNKVVGETAPGTKEYDAWIKYFKVLFNRISG